MARSIVKLLAICVLCLPLMGQDYGSGIAMVNTRSAVDPGPTGLAVIMFGGARQGIPNNDTEWYSIWGGAVSTNLNAITEAESVITTSGDFIDMYVKLSGDIGGNNDDATFTLMVNGNTTALTCTIDGKGGTQDDCPDTPLDVNVHVDPGDRVALRVVTTDGVTGVLGFSVHFIADNDDEQNFLGHYNANQSSNTRHGGVTGSIDVGQFFEDQVETLMPIGGTIGNLRIAVDVCPGAGAQRVYTLRINQADTSPKITCTISGAAGCDKFCSDTATAANTIVARDRISITDTPSGSPVAMETATGITFFTGSSGKFVFGGTSGSEQSTSVNTYTQLSGPSQYNTVINNRESPSVLAFTVTDMDVRLREDPGSGTDYVFTLLDEAADTSPLVDCAVLGTATVCDSVFSGTTAIDAKAEISIESDPSATPPLLSIVAAVYFAGTIP